MSYYKSHLLIQKVAKSINKDQTQTKIANLLYHHTHPTLLPYRRPGSLSYVLHHLSSSFNAIVSLCTSQTSRDQFLSLTSCANNNNNNSTSTTEDNYNDDDGYQGPIINTSVLGQSDMGFLKSLTLFQDLSNPLYEQYPINTREFLCGVGFGLEQFHKVKDELLPRLVKHGEEDSQSTVDDDGKGATVQANFSNYKILDIAEKDPDSLENRLVSMSTPEVSQAIQMDGVIRLLFDSMSKSESINMPMGRNDEEVNRLKEYYAKNFITDDTKVNNVALLNARIEEIYPPPTVAAGQKSQKEYNDDPDAPLEDDSLTPPQHNNDDLAPQVVTQLDVLYELQQSSINGEGKTHTQSSMMVGKFETCLSGDPNGNDSKDVQWRIASYRSAVEFYNAF